MAPFGRRGTKSLFVAFDVVAYEFHSIRTKGFDSFASEKLHAYFIITTEQKKLDKMSLKSG